MRARKAFTLVEILIVVIMLGILAAIVLPKFSNASDIARASMMRDDLRILRTQLMVYKAQHHDIAPGYPLGDRTAEPTEEAMVAQLTLATNAAGQTAVPGTAGFPYGPYLTKMPEDPINGKQSVHVLKDGDDFPVAADNDYGWVYQPSQMQVKPDCTGADEQNRNYFDY